MREVVILGVGMHPIGKFPHKSPGQLCYTAVDQALRDAGIPWRKVELAYSGSVRLGGTSGQEVLSMVGMSGIPIMNIQNDCATGASALNGAYIAVAAGLVDIALALGYEKMTGDGAPPPKGMERLFGRNVDIITLALLGKRHMYEFGYTVEQMALVSVKNHRHAVSNPKAQYRREVTLEEVLNSRMIAEPLTLLQCCPQSDGAAAAIICSATKARRFTSQPVKISASVVVSQAYNYLETFSGGIDSMSRRAAQEAYQRAGLGPQDLDLVELHDATTSAEIMHYENLGLCPPGEGVHLIVQGKTFIGGTMPVNPSGGLLALGHPLGATGLAQVYEVTRQLRGQAEGSERQINNARVGLAHTVGTGGAAASHILTR
ncbi:MAG: thiolase family protein [Chloroflexi bacterium]|nr:thiolase family protein [Chloroflexota bacterium]